MPAWFAREVIRAATAPAPRPAVPPLPQPAGPGPAAYLATVISRGAAQLAAMSDGRKRALSALAYQVGGLLDWSGGDSNQVTGQLVEAGVASGLTPGIAQRLVMRAVANGIKKPIHP